MGLNNLKHYKDMAWLFYKYGNDLDLKDFSSEIDIKQIIKERGGEKGKAEDLVNDLQSLGPFYIKLGQILSAETEMLPPEYDEALQKLQDNADPMPYDDVESVIFEEFNEMPNNLFKKFDKKPLSAASLGQVHMAELANGKVVAVKIQRKGIVPIILEQMEALTNISEFLEKNTDYGKKFHIIEKMDNLKTILLNELDYLKEANNLKVIANNLKEFDRIIVPKPVDRLTTIRVLTMDFIEGEKITELSPIQKLDADGKELGTQLFRSFIKQILVDGFYQMDPHPGNIYLTKIDNRPYLALFDLGMVSKIPYQLQGKMIRCFFAMSEGKESEVSNILISVGTKLSQFDEYHFRAKITEVIGHYQGLQIKDIPMGKVFIQFSQIAAESGLWLPIQFSMVGKTLTSLSSVLTALDPELNPSEILKDEATKLMNERLTQHLNMRSFYGSFLEGIEFLEQLPTRLNDLFAMLFKNDFQLKVRFDQTEALAKNFEKVANRITMGILLASLVIASALMMRVDAYPAFSMVLLLLAAGGSFLLILSILLSDRK